MEAIDWGKIRTEYVTGLSSYRDLAEKYGVDQSTIARHGKKEGWQEERKKCASRVQAKAARKVADRKADRMAKVLSAADLLMEKWLLVANVLDEASDPRELRQLAATLKDIEEVQMLRSELDQEEQKARIERLRKDDTQEKNEVVFTMEGIGDLIG